MEKFYDGYGNIDSHKIYITWMQSYSGQFDLWFGDANGPLFDY